MTDDGAGERDGRRLRRDRNREAVVSALLELYREGHVEPSSVEIAERAGLSARSLFRYFDDVDDLARAAIEMELREVSHLADVPRLGEGTLDERIDRLVRARARLWEAAGPVARAGRRRAATVPVLQDQLDWARASLRAQLERHFDAELALLPADDAAATLAAADVVTSFEAYELLRHDQHLSKARTAAAMRLALTALFHHTTRSTP